jgi:cation transport protein ChaC
MPHATPEMRLTPELIARVAQNVVDPGPRPGTSMPSETDYDAAVREVLEARPNGGDVWFFAYGSLIWNPGCDVVEHRTGVAHGWHRSFCLGWEKRFRGSEAHPGLMLALDRGGQCTGLLYRLPANAMEANLGKLFRREIRVKPSAYSARWLNVRTKDALVSAIAFVIDRTSDRYVGGLSIEQVADALAVAVGHWGSMADYLHNLVGHLAAYGILDRHLWRLQELVASRIELLMAANQASTGMKRQPRTKLSKCQGS